MDDVAEQEEATVNVFPNPADQRLKIESEGMTRVTAYNMLGQQVFESVCDDTVLNVNVSEWNEGVYLLKVQTSDGLSLRRVSIVH